MSVSSFIPSTTQPPNICLVLVKAVDHEQIVNLWFDQNLLKVSEEGIQSVCYLACLFPNGFGPLERTA